MSGTGDAAAGHGLRGARWRFGRCSFDGSSLILSVDGIPVALEPKPLELLVFLLRHSGEVVTKRELHENVWPGRVLSESVLSKCMAKLRQAIGDSEQTLIRTVHGYGYRFSAALECEHTGVTPPRQEIGLRAGDTPPQRPLWRLSEPLGSSAQSEVWLIEHSKTRERRVLKFAQDAERLAALKREVTLYRLLCETYGARADLLQLLDWNFDEPPYFIETEHLPAGDLRRWCEAQGGLSAIPQALRIELMAQVAEALAAAHAAGVLHRDLKPGNLLVAGTAQAPQIKLADLGCGHTLDAERLRRLAITQMGFTQPLEAGDAGTAMYLAPERLAGQPPTVKSDIYALGVMLYQMLAGDWRRPLAPGWEHDIDDPLLCEDIAGAAAGHPQERLGDAAALAVALRSLPARRAQHEQAQSARREAQRLREALERSNLRRRWSRALVLVLLAGVCLSSLGLWRASTERERAEAARAEAHATVRFLADDVLAATDPFGGGRPRLSLNDLLGEAAPKMGEKLGDFPAARAEVGLALGRAYEGLGDWEAAAARLQMALAEARAALGPEADLSLSIADRLGYVEILRGRYDAAEALYQQVYELRRRLKGEQAADTLTTRDGMAWLEYERGHFDVAAKRYEVLVEDFGRTDEEGRDSARWSLADCYLELNRNAEAEELMRAVIAQSSRQLGPEHPRVLWQRLSLGDILLTQARYDEASTEFEQASRGLVASVGELHPHSLTALHFRGQLQLERGDPVAALPLLRRAYQSRVQVHGENHVWTRYSANRVGEALVRLGLADQALPLLRSTFDAAVAAQGADHPNALLIQHNLADALTAVGDFQQAETLLRDGIVRAERKLPEGNLRTALLHESLGHLLQRQRRMAEARAELVLAQQLFAQALGPAHPRSRALLASLASL